MTKFDCVQELAAARLEVQEKDQKILGLQPSSFVASEREESLQKENTVIAKQNNILASQLAIVTRAGPSSSASAIASLQQEINLLKTSVASTHASLELTKASEAKLIAKNGAQSTDLANLKLSLKKVLASESKISKENEALRQNLREYTNDEQVSPLIFDLLMSR